MAFRILPLWVCVLGLGLPSNAQNECLEEASSMLQVKKNFDAAVDVPEDIISNDGAAQMHVDEDEGDFEDWELADDDDPPHDEDDDDPVGSVDLNFFEK